MRLPFLQLESDIIAHGAAEVSHLAGCSTPQALGHIALVRAWAVSHASDDAPPDGWVPGESAGRRIEAAAHWTGEKGALVQALIDSGHVGQEDGGLRVLHLECYVQAWNKNRTAKERMRTLRERSANTGERAAKFGQQTQTQTQREEKDSTASQALTAPPEDIPEHTAAVEERPALVLVPQKVGKPPRKQPPGEALYVRLEARRKEACERDGLPFVESRWAFSRQNKELGPLARAEQEEPKGETWTRFVGAWVAFLEDTEVAGRRDEPYALDFFWRFRSRYEGRALREATT